MKVNCTLYICMNKVVLSSHGQKVGHIQADGLVPAAWDDFRLRFGLGRGGGRLWGRWGVGRGGASGGALHADHCGFHPLDGSRGGQRRRL